MTPQLEPASKSISVGYDPEFEPLAFKHNGDAKGLIIERTSFVLNRAGLTFSFHPVAMDNMIPRLNSGRVQLITGIAANLHRKTQLQLSEPLALTGGAWFRALHAKIPTDRQEAEKNPTPGSVVTPETGPLVNFIAKQFPAVHLITCADYPSALECVLQGNVEAAALNLQVGTRLCQNRYPGLFELPSRPFLTIPLTLASRKDDKSLLIKRLNSHIPGEWSAQAG